MAVLTVFMTGAAPAPGLLTRHRLPPCPDARAVSGSACLPGLGSGHSG
jgi:hypothetical protein